MHVLNYTNRPLTFRPRNGLCMKMPPISNQFRHDLVIRTTWTFREQVKSDIQRVLNVVGETDSKELNAFKEAYRLVSPNNRFGANLVLEIDYPLTLEDLMEYGGTIYHHELDALISVLTPDSMPPHPYSEAGENTFLVEAHSQKFRDFGFGYSIKMVDSTGRYGARFINIGGKVYRVRPVTDHSCRDGIYVASSTPLINDLKESADVVRHYPFEGAEESLGLYKTSEEAFDLGDAATARRTKLAEVEHDNQLVRRNLISIQSEHALLMAEKDRELAMQRTSNEQLSLLVSRATHVMDLDKQRMKDHYDERSHKRKDSSEWLKFIPAVIVGFATVLGALKILIPVK